MGEYKSQTSTLPQSGKTLWYHLCSQLWVESDRLRPEFDCKSIFAPFLSWPYLTSLLNRLLVKNLYLRFFLWGAKTIFFSYNVFISSPFLLSLYVSIEHYHTTAFSSKYTVRLSNLITGTDNREDKKERNPSSFWPNINMGVCFFKCK